MFVDMKENPQNVRGRELAIVQMSLHVQRPWTDFTPKYIFEGLRVRPKTRSCKITGDHARSREIMRDHVRSLESGFGSGGWLDDLKTRSREIIPAAPYLTLQPGDFYPLMTFLPLNDIFTP